MYNGMLRMACRVCLRLGVSDPERWLDEQPKRVVYLWAAYYRLEPWGNEWLRSAMLLQTLHWIGDMVAAWITGGKHKPTAYEISRWMPSDWVSPLGKQGKRKTLRKQLDVLAKMFGGGDNAKDQ